MDFPLWIEARALCMLPLSYTLALFQIKFKKKMFLRQGLRNFLKVAVNLPPPASASHGAPGMTGLCHQACLSASNRVFTGTLAF